MPYTGTPHLRHQVTTKEPEICTIINIFQCSHKMRCMKITRGLAYYQKIPHRFDYLTISPFRFHLLMRSMAE